MVIIPCIRTIIVTVIMSASILEISKLNEVNVVLGPAALEGLQGEMEFY